MSLAKLSPAKWGTYWSYKVGFDDLSGCKLMMHTCFIYFLKQSILDEVPNIVAKHEAQEMIVQGIGGKYYMPSTVYFPCLICTIF